MTFLLCMNRVKLPCDVRCYVLAFLVPAEIEENEKRRKQQWVNIGVETLICISLSSPCESFDTTSRNF
jgi:hypothetical protein